VVGDPALLGLLTSSPHKYGVINAIFTEYFKIQLLNNMGSLTVGTWQDSVGRCGAVMKAWVRRKQ